MKPFDEIVEYFEKNRPITGPVRLDVCTTVIDTEHFVNLYIEVLKKNRGNKLYLPYYERLEKFYKIQLSHGNTDEHRPVCEENRQEPRNGSPLGS